MSEMEEGKESSSSVIISSSSENKGVNKKKLERQRSRLQMQAPSSIQVTHTSISSLSDWNIPIPLLSPLDFPNPLHHHHHPPANTATNPSSSSVDVTDHQELMIISRQREEKDDGETKGSKSGASWRGWQHPAAPFHYDPVPGNAPAFLLPSHCA